MANDKNWEIEKKESTNYDNGTKGSIGNSDEGEEINYDVSKENEKIKFKFYVGLFDGVANSNSLEFKQELYLKAENKIKEYINSGEIQNQKQFNFEFDGDDFSPV